MKARILLVDDDPLQRRVLRKWLSLDDYDLIEAQDGTSAWQEVRRQPPDLIISDWMMPGMDGLDLCRLLRSNPSTCHCYVILLTARDDSTSLVAGLETGADEFLTKPIDGTSLRARVKAGLRQYQHRSALQAANAHLESLALTDALKQLLLQSKVWAPLEPTNATHLSSVFQPIFSLKDGSCFGHEALIRGRAKNGTTVSAARVFEYIESTGFIHEFDELARIIHLDSIDQLQPHGYIFMNLIPSSPEQSAREISH